MDNAERVAQIEKRLKPYHPVNFDVLPEWEELVIKLDEDLAAIDPGYTITQVKEKFGGLRFYYTASESCSYEDYEEMRNLVDAAESKSYQLLKG